MEVVSFLYRRYSSLLSLQYFQQKQQQQQQQQQRTKKCNKYVFLIRFTMIGIFFVTFYQVRLALITMETTTSTVTKTRLLLNADNDHTKNNINNTKVIHTYYYYSYIRADRSGAFVHDMLMAHAFTFHKNQEWELQTQQQEREQQKQQNDLYNMSHSSDLHNVIVRVRYAGACWKNGFLWSSSPRQETIELLTALQLLPSILPLQRCPVEGSGVHRGIARPDRLNQKRQQHPITMKAKTTTDTTTVKTEQELDELHQQFLQHPNQQQQKQKHVEESKTRYQYHDHHIILNKKIYRDYDSQLFSNEWRQYLQQQQQQQQQQHVEKELQQLQQQQQQQQEEEKEGQYLRYKVNTKETTPTSRATTTVTPDLLNISQQMTTTTQTTKRPYRIVVHIRRGDVYPCSDRRYLTNQHYVRVLHEYALKQLLRQKQQEQYSNHNENTAKNMTSMNDLYYEIIIHTESKSFESMDDLIYKFQHYQNHSPMILEQQEQRFHLVNNELQFRIDSPLSEVWSDIRTADVAILSRSSFSYVPALLNTKGRVVYTPFWHDPPPPPQSQTIFVGGTEDGEEQQKWDNDWNISSSIRSTANEFSAPLSPWIIVSQNDLKIDEEEVRWMKKQFCSQYDRKKARRKQLPANFRSILKYFDPLEIPPFSSQDTMTTGRRGF